MNLAEQSFATQLEAAGSKPEPGFVAALRGAGRDTFLTVKLPTTRHEDWLFTNLAPLGALAFGPGAVFATATADLPPAPRLVFANGRLDPAATDLAGLPAGVRLGSLAAALRDRPGTLEPLLGRLVETPPHAFAALNTALFEDGALVEVDERVVCTPTIHLVFTSAGGAAAVASHPRNLITLAREARATVVEHYRGAGTYLVNAVTEVAVGEGAELEHDRLQEDGPEAFHIGLLHVSQGAGSRFLGQSVALGGRLGRVEARALLGAERATCDLHGLNVSAGAQVHDHFVRVDHASPRCTSREVFKGVLDGHSRGSSPAGCTSGRTRRRPTPAR